MKGKSERCSTYLHTYQIICCMYINRWNTFCFSPSYQINLSKVEEVVVSVFVCVETRSAQYKTGILTGLTLVT